jgi:hypothetical protein
LCYSLIHKIGGGSGAAKMNIQRQLIEADSQPQKRDSGSQIMHLLAGLERQKEELGPIADELINVLRQLGIETLPQANDKSQSGKP